jgi:hypothetical protein
MTNDPRIPNADTGDLDLARIMLAHDDFVEGHIGVAADEWTEALGIAPEGDAPASEPGVVSVHLNGDVVEMLLAARGFKRGDNGAWFAPDGDSMHWDRADALVLALTAEVV